jgi:hypothetical protein
MTVGGVEVAGSIIAPSCHSVNEVTDTQSGLPPVAGVIAFVHSLS